MVRDKDAGLPHFQVRDAVAADLASVVKVHQQAFREFFLERMGPRFLKAYYASILSYEAAIFLVNVDDSGEIDGFAVGFLDPGAYYDHFRSRRFRLAPIIALSLLRRPSLLIEILHNTRRLATSVKTTEKTIELSSIGTSRLGTGVGSALLRAFCSRSREMRADEVALTTDRDHNESVLEFYLRHGFKRRGIEVRGARVLQVMSLDLSPST